MYLQIATMTKTKINKTYKGQKGVVFIITALVILAIIVLLVLAVDMARLYEVRQTLHTQAQLMAEAGAKLRAQEELKDNKVNIVKIITGEYEEGGKILPILGEGTMNFIKGTVDNNKDAECDFTDCNGQIGFTCKVSAKVDPDTLIFKGIFEMILGKGNAGMSISARGTSCYDQDANDIGLYPFRFTE